MSTLNKTVDSTRAASKLTKPCGFYKLNEIITKAQQWQRKFKKIIISKN